MVEYNNNKKYKIELIDIPLDKIKVNERYLLISDNISFCNFKEMINSNSYIFYNYVTRENVRSEFLTIPDNFIKKIYLINFNLPIELNKLISSFT